MNIDSLGEFGLIKLIKERVGNPSGFVGIGDDCAVIKAGDTEFLISVDALIEGVHFFSDTNPYYLGRKSLAVNISDVAAMAGVPKWAFLSLSLRDGVSLEWVDAFVDGFLELADEYGVILLGGDTTRSDVTVVNVTIVGENVVGGSVLRSKARVGDKVVVSGSIGCSFAGFKAIELGLVGFENLKMRHINPTPRVNEALKIRDIATAMIDISDGFIQDCSHIAEASQVKIELFFDKIPFCNVDLVSKEEMLCGGEDYEIIACLKPDASVPSSFFEVGIVKEGYGVEIVKNGEKLEIGDCGYRHF